MRIFLDTSVLIAACGSDRGASHEVFCQAPRQGWRLIASPFVLEESLVNLPNLPATATSHWPNLRSQLTIMDDVLTLDRVSIFAPAKDRPILFSAVAWADVLLTLDRKDFGSLIGGEFYGLSILTPGMFLANQALKGRMKI